MDVLPWAVVVAPQAAARTVVTGSDRRLAHIRLS